MKGPKFLQKEFLSFLVTSSSPGVFGFINFMEKKVWVSYSENVSEAILRNIKLIETRQHRIKNLEGWDVCVFTKTEDKNSAKNHFRIVCQNYRSKGLEVLNKEFNYKIWGIIEPHFKKSDEYLYYVWIGTKNRKMAVLGIFDKALEGEEFLKKFKKTNSLEFPNSSKRLLLEYKSFNKNKAEYNKVFNDEVLP